MGLAAIICRSLADISLHRRCKERTTEYYSDYGIWSCNITATEIVYLLNFPELQFIQLFVNPVCFLQ